MVRIDGVNWCMKYSHEIDSKLVREMAPPCIKEHNGCGNCPNITYKIFKDGMEIDNNEGPADFYNAIKALMRYQLEELVVDRRPCVICGTPSPMGKVTCCDDHHEEYIQKVEAQFGPYKKVIDMESGIAFKVPVRDIIEKGLKQPDLINYPEWEGSARVQ